MHWAAFGVLFLREVQKKEISLNGFCKFRQISIKNLPVYNQDFDDDNVPLSYTAFRKTIGESDGVIFVIPEHNRSVPAALKNLPDIASRPDGQNK